MNAPRDPAYEPAATSSPRRPLRGAGIVGGIVLAIVVGLFVWWLLAVALAGEVVLVVPEAADAPGEVEEGQLVRVTGTVRAFEFEPAFGDEDDFGDFAEFNAIFATSVTPAEEDAEAVGGVELDDLGEDEELEGEQVTVIGEVVEDDLGNQSFAIEEAD